MTDEPSGHGSVDELAENVPRQSPGDRAAECWVFDVDACLVDSLTATSLRPGARRLLEHLSTGRRRVVLWSAGGETHARAQAEKFGLVGFVSACCAKDGRDADGRYRVAHLPLGGCRPVFVDDRPEDVAAGFEVHAVSPYLSDDPHDRGLQAVARRAGLH